MSTYLLKNLNEAQKKVCLSQDNLLVTACPGSGKTRTLTHKIAHILENSDSVKWIVAITFTNRAADEIIKRLSEFGIDYSRLWVGTIHQFCLDFILNRFKMYNLNLSRGYKIIDERVSGLYIRAIAKKYGVSISYDNQPNLRVDRNLNSLETNDEYKQIIKTYYQLLKEQKEIDFDMILAQSYRLLKMKPIICSTIKNSIELLCVDEYQDTQDLQYAIIEKIFNSNENILMQVNFFGDPNQAIYESLGGCAKDLNQINKEFFDSSFHEIVLDGCYRSPQNIIDFYSSFMVSPYKIVSKQTENVGGIFFNETISHNDLYIEISRIIKYHLNSGISPEDICVVAPVWKFLFPFSKQIKHLLPNVPFDAPDITPIKKDPLNVFYKICYLLLTKPSLKKHLFRIKTAKEILSELQNYTDVVVNEIDFLNFVNSIKLDIISGVSYICSALEIILKYLKIEINNFSLLKDLRDNFIAKIRERLNNKYYDLTDDIEDFKNMFKEKNGVVINTCHGIKGEEYKVVIAFGLLGSKIPSSFTQEDAREQTANHLLYVIASRTKKYLYLFSEKGRPKESDFCTPYLSCKLSQDVIRYTNFSEIVKYLDK